MSNFTRILDACDQVGRLARESGLGLLDVENTRLDGRTLEVDGRTLFNFSSCSYLGLELDERLIEGAIDATRRFGTQFSMSRAFASAPPYADLESLLEEMTGHPTLVLPTTTLATMAALPSVIEEGDAVLFDQQVHMSVQSVAPTLSAIGVHLETIPHARLDVLESRLKELETKARRVWYLADGVFSMHGDILPISDLAGLRARYPSLHLFLDDAHGTSWSGLHGRGVAIERLPSLERTIVALSLNKSFGAGGGALCFPDESMKRRVRHVSGPTNFSGPLQPPMLGAAVASARVHLAPDFRETQGELEERIDYANHQATDLGLPLLHADARVPVRFLGLGPQEVSVEIAQALMRAGFMAGCALFPAVPAHQTGIRFTITRHQRLSDIESFLDTIHELLPAALAHAGIRRDALDRVFGLKMPTRASSAPG